MKYSCHTCKFENELI